MFLCDPLKLRYNRKVIFIQKIKHNFLFFPAIHVILTVTTLNKGFLIIIFFILVPHLFQANFKHNTWFLYNLPVLIYNYLVLIYIYINHHLQLSTTLSSSTTTLSSSSTKFLYLKLSFPQGQLSCPHLQLYCPHLQLYCPHLHLSKTTMSKNV